MTDGGTARTLISIFLTTTHELMTDGTMHPLPRRATSLSISANTTFHTTLE